jgi:3-isopropylmalate/(R)-2-methylmalate dehydratase small subunit
MKPFQKLTAVAAPLPEANIDTDIIFPARFLLLLEKKGICAHLFNERRAKTANRNARFVLDQPPFDPAEILVAGANFGVGSSREHAVWALADFGIRCVIAPSFGDIHYGNELQNGMLPVILPDATCQKLRQQLRDQPGAQIGIDLESQTVTGPDGATYHFEIDATHKERLLKGLDDIGLVMQNIREIEAFEKKHHQALPWLA